MLHTTSHWDIRGILRRLSQASTDIVLHVWILIALQRGFPDGFIQLGRQYPKILILRGNDRHDNLNYEQVEVFPGFSDKTRFSCNLTYKGRAADSDEDDDSLADFWIQARADLRSEWKFRHI